MRTWLALRKTARRLARIPSDRDRSLIPKVLLAGEIFVRSDELSCQGIDDMYAAEGMMIKRADSLEWVYFTNWHYLNRLAEEDRYPRRFLDKDIFLKKLKNAVFKRSPASRRFIAGRLKLAFEQFIEARIRGMLGRSGWLVTGQHNIDHVVRRGSCFINPALYGEAILTAGSAVQMMEHAPKENYCGVVFIGPFNCMPTGVAESVIKPYARENAIPYLTFETDGGPIPSNLQSQMEVHVLRSRRYADAMTLRKAS
jgi:predicted nucleotide-binding protein (sugar kinase/HSP70/actin superfamily)